MPPDYILHFYCCHSTLDSAVENGLGDGNEALKNKIYHLYHQMWFILSNKGTVSFGKHGQNNEHAYLKMNYTIMIPEMHFRCWTCEWGILRIKYAWKNTKEIKFEEKNSLVEVLNSTKWPESRHACNPWVKMHQECSLPHIKI